VLGISEKKISLDIEIVTAGSQQLGQSTFAACCAMIKNKARSLCAIGISKFNLITRFLLN